MIGKKCNNKSSTDSTASPANESPMSILYIILPLQEHPVKSLFENVGWENNTTNTFSQSKAPSLQHMLAQLHDVLGSSCCRILSTCLVFFLSFPSKNSISLKRLNCCHCAQLAWKGGCSLCFDDLCSCFPFCILLLTENALQQHGPG